MRSRVIFTGLTYTVISYGNGTAYKIEANLEDESTYIQGDDAAKFRDDWEAYENNNPEMLIDDIIGELVSEFPFTKD